MRKSRIEAALLLLACALGAASGWREAHALSSDHDQPINIAADQAEADDMKQVTTYTGDVVITQGSIRINGDTVTVYYDHAHKMTKMIVVGKPAHFRQLPDGKQTYQQARARRMEYYASQDLIILLNDAHAWEGEKQISGQRILYDTKKSQVKAEGNRKAKQRVHITIPQNQGKNQQKNRDKGSTQ